MQVERDGIDRRGVRCRRRRPGPAERLRQQDDFINGLTISPDGKALYVLNYERGTVTKLRTSDMRTLQTISACSHPIGITYDRAPGRVWVACYTASIRVNDDR